MSKNARTFRGPVKLNNQSSLRKIMRAFRRGQLPSEHLGIIERAIESAEKRRLVYMNSAQRVL
jgi:hypothetical protein